MTKRQKKIRVEQISAKLVAHLRERFPAVELLSVEEWAGEGTILRVYAPYEDTTDLLEWAVDPIVELLVNEGITISILPVSVKPAQQAA